MGVRMGICARNPEDYPKQECSMAYDSRLINLLKHVQTSCIKCKHYSQKYELEDDGYNKCYGCYRGMDGYYILPKQILLDNPNVINYDTMLSLFEEENVDEIYIILF